MVIFSLLLVGLASATVHYVEEETTIIDFDTINQLDSLAQRELQRQLHEHYGSVEVAEGERWTVYGGGAKNFRRAHAQLRNAHSHNDYHFKHEAAFATKFVCAIYFIIFIVVSAFVMLSLFVGTQLITHTRR